MDSQANEKRYAMVETDALANKQHSAASGRNRKKITTEGAENTEKTKS